MRWASFSTTYMVGVKTMTIIELKKIILVSSVSVMAAFGLSACGDDDKAKAPAAVEETTGGGAGEAHDAMDAAKEKAGEVMDAVEEKAGDMMDEAEEKAGDMMDEAKEKAEEEAKKAEEALKSKIPD